MSQKIQQGLSNVAVLIVALLLAVVLFVTYKFVKPSAAPTPTGSNLPALSDSPISSASAIPESSVTAIEEDQMIEAATPFIKKYSVPDIKFNLTLKKRYGDWALLQVTPLNAQVDPAMVIMQKVSGQWQPVEFGTDFPERMQQVPQLFQ